MAGLSLASLIGQALPWTLTSLDDNVSVVGQYHPEGMEKNVSSNYSQGRTLGRPQPILQFDSENADTISFTARIWAAHEGLGVNGAPFSEAINSVLNRTDSIEDLAEQIEGMPRYVPELGRARIWTFAVGSSRRVEMTCVVESVGPIQFAHFRPLNGDLRGATFQISLIRFEEYDVTLGGDIAESLIVTVRDNESFESLARRVYGDASPGEALRRRNPDKVQLASGDEIHMPPIARLTTGVAMTPQSPVLQRNDITDPRRREHEKKRQRDYESYSLGSQWDGVK